jgi:hypothetical protein
VTRAGVHLSVGSSLRSPSYQDVVKKDAMPAETGWSMSRRLGSFGNRHRVLMASLITNAPVVVVLSRVRRAGTDGGVESDH